MEATARAWASLDLGALSWNLGQLRRLLPSGCQVMAVVKADAYGHGALPVAKALQENSVHAFCVACLEEAVALRRGGIRGEILILGYTHPAQFPQLLQYDLTQAILDLDYAKALAAYGPVKGHLALDTGMHRLGLDAGNHDAIGQIFALPRLRVTGLFTHLCADTGTAPAQRVFTQAQADTFWTAVRLVRRHGYAPRAHLLSSYGLLYYPQLGGDYARLGIALYGLGSRRDLPPGIALRPVLSLHARVSGVRTVAAGQSVGYGFGYTAPGPRAIATLTIGYADGIPAALPSGMGHVGLHGGLAPIVGSVCMDQLMVDVTGLPPVKQGDIATLFGPGGPSAYDLAAAAGLTTNALLSGLGPRLPRIVASAQ